MSDDTDEQTERPSHIGERGEGQKADVDADGDGAADAESPADGPDEDPATAAARRAAQTAKETTGVETDDAASAGDVAVEAAAEQVSADAAESVAQLQGATGVELPDEASLQAAMANANMEAGPEEGAVGTTRRDLDAENAATAEDAVRVLEFTLGDEHYCLDISHVEEIVKRDSITRVPNTPDYVEGVVDLRGQITTILDPKLLLDIDQEGSESLLVVFAPDEFEDQGAIGWVVDEVRQVAPIVKSEVSEPPVDADYVEGVIDREGEDEFVIWTNPEVAIELATGERDDD